MSEIILTDAVRTPHKAATLYGPDGKPALRQIDNRKARHVLQQRAKQQLAALGYSGRRLKMLARTIAEQTLRRELAKGAVLGESF